MKLCLARQPASNCRNEQTDLHCHDSRTKLLMPGRRTPTRVTNPICDEAKCAGNKILFESHDSVHIVLSGPNRRIEPTSPLRYLWPLCRFICPMASERSLLNTRTRQSVSSFAKFKCANVLVAFLWRSENVPLFAAARPILLSFFELPRMMTFKSTGSGATPARACSVLVLHFVPVEREHAG